MSRIHTNSNGLRHSCALRAGIPANDKKIKEYVDCSLMLVTALSSVIGYDKLSKIAFDNLTLKDAALKLRFVSEEEFDHVVEPTKMVHPYVAKARLSGVLVTGPISEMATSLQRKENRDDYDCSRNCGDRNEITQMTKFHLKLSMLSRHISITQSIC